MDESALRDRLSRIEQRQNLILVLLVLPYLLGVVERFGLWVAGVLGTVFGFLVLVMIVFYRRLGRNAVESELG